MGNIAQKRGWEANIARVVHECKQSFNWLLVVNNSVLYFSLCMLEYASPEIALPTGIWQYGHGFTQ